MNTPLPESYFLKRIQWQMFGTLTFSDFLPEPISLKKFLVLTRKLAKQNRVYWPKLLWVLRQEHGQEYDIPHFHFLVAGLPQQALCTKSCRQIRDTWKHLGGGLARIELYNPALDGLDYILKCSGEKSGNSQPRSGNLEDTCGLMLSNSIQAHLKRS